MGEEKRTPDDDRPERDEGEPTPIFDAVFSATRAQADSRAPAPEPGKTGR